MQNRIKNRLKRKIPKFLSLLRHPGETILSFYCLEKKLTKNYEFLLILQKITLGRQIKKVWPECHTLVLHKSFHLAFINFGF